MIDKMARWDGGVAEVVEAMVMCKKGEVEDVTDKGLIELLI